MDLSLPELFRRNFALTFGSRHIACSLRAPAETHTARWQLLFSKGASAIPFKSMVLVNSELPSLAVLQKATLSICSGRNVVCNPAGSDLVAPKHLEMCGGQSGRAERCHRRGARADDCSIRKLEISLHQVLMQHPMRIEE